MLQKLSATSFAVISLIVFVTTSFLANNAAAARSRGSSRSRGDRNGENTQVSEATAKMNEAAQQIKDDLKTILGDVNSSKRPDEQTLSAADQAAKAARRYLTKFETKAQCDYSLLTAWLFHFDTDPQKACLSASKAFKAEPEDSDARVSQVALSIIAGKRPVLKAPVPRKTSSRSKSKSRSRSSSSVMSTPKFSKGILDFDVEEIRTNAIRPKIEQLQLNCTDSTSFSYTPGESNLCILFWQLAPKTNAPAIEEKIVETAMQQLLLGSNGITSEPNGLALNTEGLIPENNGLVSEPNGLTKVMVKPPKIKTQYDDFDDEYGNGSDPFTQQVKAFTEIYNANISNPAVKFLAVNTDSPANRFEALREIMQNPKPWPQVVASDKNSNADMFANAKIEIDKPVMAIVSKSGSVMYAGPAAGFMAPMIVER